MSLQLPQIKLGQLAGINKYRNTVDSTYPVMPIEPKLSL